MTKQIKSKEHVAEHGEAHTDEREVITLDGGKFLERVKGRNLKRMSKSDWEMEFFYACVANDEKKLGDLTTSDVDGICRELNLSYQEASSLIKKCRVIEQEIYRDQNMSLSLNYFTSKGRSVLADLTKDHCTVRFEIHNPIVMEQFRCFLRQKEVIQDSSFNRDIVSISVEAYLKLSGHGIDTLRERLTSDAQVIMNAFSKFIRGTRDEKEKDKICETLQREIARNDLTALVKTVVSYTGEISVSRVMSFIMELMKKGN